MKLSEQLQQDHECGDFGKALDGYAERARNLEDQIEWIWKHCRVIYQDVCNNYPIEHCAWVKKDNRAFIESQMEPYKEKPPNM